MCSKAVLLQVNNLSASYNAKKVLDNISFSVGKGETVAVIGESGAGKTTLGLAVAGLTRAEVTGQALWGGKDLFTLDEAGWQGIRWNNISVVFQNVSGALNPVQTAINQVAEPVIEHGKMKKKAALQHAAGLLSRVGLNPNKHALYPHQLSGGEKQRVLMAMALANDPELIILDEPTAALDAVNRSQITELLYKVGRDKALLLVTHDISLAAALADTVLVLYNGVLVEAGPARLVLTNPRHPYTRGLLRCYPNMTTTKDLVGIKGRTRRNTGGCRFHNRCTQALPRCAAEEPALEECHGRLLACHRGGIIPFLEVQGLKKHYGTIHAVDGVDLTLYEGETLAVVGASGSGKSTLAHTVMGLEKPTAGEIKLEGNIIKKRDKHFYRKVQMVFQNPHDSINHRSSVLDAVQEPLDIQGIGTREERLATVRKCLEEVELPSDEEFLATYPHHLSGGEAQRVTIARALVLNPGVLIADEPTSALDPSVQAKILKLLLNLQEKRGLAILFITHDIALARKVSDRIAVMWEGRIVEEGPAGEITANPRTEYARQLLRNAASLGVRDSKLEVINY
ncbi:ABC transporter ATP-binding protein [Desulfallas thermosapovorans]|uniref:Peptide/nickel transport system ATP-binding protein n=1 Tax=Desulfallas thermosapovorans DSM 6562 TaxID=1121431 RepID=A0A5S4ZQV4_9FIRM|nr:ABC transporter ATP-binding protein [Desulfallas thermosapovorans]TYO95292.1 peptide/nickel transport system ATP-binding protein [Desulfallas thermosapovorans DSM 6562]